MTRIVALIGRLWPALPASGRPKATTAKGSLHTSRCTTNRPSREVKSDLVSATPRLPVRHHACDARKQHADERQGEPYAGEQAHH